MLSNFSPRSAVAAKTAFGMVFALMLCLCAAGCQDGPLYALKEANPYFTMREWRQDRLLGVTDHERREQLSKLARQIGRMPDEEQLYWSEHLSKILNNDPSAEMRRLSVLAASRLSSPAAIDLIEQGLDDDSIKVQMESCRALGNRKEPQAAQLLASTLGTTPEQDVKNSAIRALGNHQGAVPVESLRLVLEDQDPATVHLAMSSLRGATGKDYGNDPKQWIAALDQQNAEPENVDSEIRFAQGAEDSDSQLR